LIEEITKREILINEQIVKIEELKRDCKYLNEEKIRFEDIAKNLAIKSELAIFNKKGIFKKLFSNKE